MQTLNREEREWDRKRVEEIMPASSHTLGLKCSEKQTVSRTDMKKPILKHNAVEVLKTESKY